MASPHVLPSLTRPFFAGVLIVFAAMLALWLWTQAASLSAITVGTGSPAVVLLHGYGSRAEDWLQFADHIRVPNNGRLIFPQGPVRGPFSGSQRRRLRRPASTSPR